MYEHVMVETLLGTFNAISGGGGGGGGGNVYDVMSHINAANLRGLTSFKCVLYDVVSENHSVQNSPLGGGSL